MTSTYVDLGVSVTERGAVAALVRTLGEAGAAAALGLSRHTVVRLLAGLPMRAGSVFQIKARLEALAKEKSTP